MNKFWYIILLMILGHEISAQKVSRRGSFKMRNQPLAGLASLPNLQILYRGIDNPVEVLTSGASAKEVSFSCDGCRIKTSREININRNTTKLILIPETDSATLTLSMSYKGQLFHQQVFRVKNVPTPKAKFAGIKGSGTAPLSKVRSAAGIIADLGDFMFPTKFTIVSFTISTLYKGSPVEKKIRGNRITPDAAALISSLKPGSKLYIEDIVGIGGDGKTRNLDGIVIKIL